MRVIATMCWICDHTGDSGSVIHVTLVVKEKLACTILTVAPNSNQMGSRVAITHTHQSCVTTENIHGRRQIEHLSDTIISTPLPHAHAWM